MSQDHYKTLGVSRTATDKEIQKAYRKLAREYHPDLHPDDEKSKEKFQEVQQAYDVLSDPKKRRMFDQYGSEDPRGNFRPGGQELDFSQMFGGGGGGAGNPFADLFGMGGQRGGPGRQPRQQKGQDATVQIYVPFNTAAIGGESQIASGSGEKVNVKIPAGTEDKGKLRLKQMGHPSPTGGPKGDMLVIVNVAAHPFFQRRGNDLELKVPITLSEAVNGAKIEVPSPHGPLIITIPPACSSGKRLRLKGQGIHPKDKTAGDLIAEVQIVLPDEIDEETKDTIQKLAAFQHEPRKEIRW
ncbi:MAG: curved DNA-binding protein [Pirellulaceae bacterium]|jgi:curved DNA-binding protein